MSLSAAVIQLKAYNCKFSISISWKMPIFSYKTSMLFDKIEKHTMVKLTRSFLLALFFTSHFNSLFILTIWCLVQYCKVFQTTTKYLTKVILIAQEIKAPNAAAFIKFFFIKYQK